MTTGQRIKEARKKAGLTQKGLGQKLGITYQTVAQWENDLRNPKAETLNKIAEALSCDFYWLMTGINRTLEEEAAEIVMQIYNTDDPYVYKSAHTAAHMARTLYKDLGYSFSHEETKLVTAFGRLSPEGQTIAIATVEKLTEIPEYQAAPGEDGHQKTAPGGPGAV